MERSSSFEGKIHVSHLILKATQLHAQIGKILYQGFIKNAKKMNLLALSLLLLSSAENKDFIIIVIIIIIRHLDGIVL